MKVLRRSLLLVLLAVLLTVGGALATWVFSNGGIEGASESLSPSLGDFAWPQAVYISRARVETAREATGQVISYLGTLLRSGTSLGAAADALVTYQVEFLNNAAIDMAYAGITVPEGGHSNPAIAYRVGDILDGAIVKPGERITLTLSFSYAAGVSAVRDLASAIRFEFGEPIIFEEEEPGFFQPGENYNTIVQNVMSNFNGYGLNDSHKGSVVHNNLKTRGLLYNGDKGVSGGQLDKFHEALQVDDTKNIEFVLQYVSDIEYIMYLFSKDDAGVGDDIMVYRQFFHYDGTAEKWVAGSALRGHAEVKTFTFYSRTITSIKPEDWAVGEAPQ